MIEFLKLLAKHNFELHKPEIRDDGLRIVLEDKENERLVACSISHHEWDRPTEDLLTIYIKPLILSLAQ